MEISLIFNTVSHRQNISMGYFIGKKVTDKQTNSNFINIDLVHIHYLLQLCYTCLMPYKNHLEMSNHKKVRFLCNQCEFKAAGKGSLKKHSCKYMRVASIYVIYVSRKLGRKAISKDMKCHYTRG